jgi:hypothetical protein
MNKNKIFVAIITTMIAIMQFSCSQASGPEQVSQTKKTFSVIAKQLNGAEANTYSGNTRDAADRVVFCKVTVNPNNPQVGDTVYDTVTIAGGEAVIVYELSVDDNHYISAKAIDVNNKVVNRSIVYNIDLEQGAQALEIDLFATVAEFGAAIPSIPTGVNRAIMKRNSVVIIDRAVVVGQAEVLEDRYMPALPTGELNYVELLLEGNYLGQIGIGLYAFDTTLVVQSGTIVEFNATMRYIGPNSDQIKGTLTITAKIGDIGVITLNCGTENPWISYTGFPGTKTCPPLAKSEALAFSSSETGLGVSVLKYKFQSEDSLDSYCDSAYLVDAANDTISRVGISGINTKVLTFHINAGAGKIFYAVDVLKLVLSVRDVASFLTTRFRCSSIVGRTVSKDIQVPGKFDAGDDYSSWSDLVTIGGL